MALHLYMHPFASFCQKVIMAFHETETRFEPHVVDLGNPTERAALVALWPFGKFPVVRDDATGEVIAESTIILEYLAAHHRDKIALLPSDADAARATRFRDRFFDVYVDEPMQKIVTDVLRPEGKHDPFGVAHARTTLRTALDFIEREMVPAPWALGEAFTFADCAAAPALHYANRVMPFAASHPITFAYLERLSARPSFARVLEEAAPFNPFFPYREALHGEKAAG